MPAKPYLVTRPLIANRPGQEGAAKILRCGAGAVFAGSRRASEDRTLLLADAVKRDGKEAGSCCSREACRRVCK